MFILFLESGCDKPIPPDNGAIEMESFSAVAALFCNPGYTIAGSNQALCDGSSWDRSLGKCRETHTGPETWCDFEVDDYCGWTSDPTHDYEWKRRNGIVTNKILKTGPKHDHTTMVPLEGYFMVAMSNDQQSDDAARLISPLYPAEKSANACFRFYTHMFGQSVGRLRVYIKPLSVEMDQVLSENK